MEIILYIEIGILIGAAKGWLVANEKYTEAFKKLSTGNDYLVMQAIKFRNLHPSAKKQLPQELEYNAMNNLINP